MTATDAVSVALPVRSEAAADSKLAAIERYRPDILATVTILVLTGLVAWQRLWLQNGLAHLDISTFYMPWYAYMGEQLRNFHIPGWNAHNFSGAPFAGDPQSGWMYLPAMLIFPFFNARAAYEIFLIFHLVLAGVATYAYTRVIGLRPIAALTAAVAYEFGPLVNHISCCVIHVQLAVWIPLALLSIELMMRSNTWRGRAAAWSVTGLTISQMLAGWTGQGAYNGMLVVATYITYRALWTQVPGLFSKKQRAARMIVDGAGTFMFGFGLAAAGILPRLDVVGRTNLAGGEYQGFEVDNYAGGWKLITLFDRMLTDDNGFRSLTFYLGAPVIALMLMAPFLSRRRYRTTYFVLLVTVVSFLTLQRTPVHELLFIILPKFKQLHSHVPSRILAIQWIGPATLAGTAVELLLGEQDRTRIRRAVKYGAILWGVGIVSMIVLRRGITITTVLFVIAACVVAWLFASRRVWDAQNPGTLRTVLAAGLVLLVFLDPAGRGLASSFASDQENALLEIPTGPVSRSAIAVNASSSDPGGAGEYFQELQDKGAVFRYVGYDNTLMEAGNGYPSTYREYYWLPEAQALLVNARSMMLGIEDAQGYNPMQLTRYTNALNFVNHSQQNYHDAQILPDGLDSPILNLLNVRFIVIPNDLAGARPRPEIANLIATHKEVFRNDEVRVLENESALPRAWIVHDANTGSIDFNLLMIDSGIVDPAKIAMLEPGTPDLDLVTPADASAEQVTVSAEKADHVELQATLGAAGIVLVSQTYDPGWHAYVDGKRVDLYAADGVISAVPVPAGTHTITLKYEPASLKAGVALSSVFAGLMLFLIAAWVWTRGRVSSGGLDSTDQPERARILQP